MTDFSQQNDTHLTKFLNLFQNNSKTMNLNILQEAQNIVYGQREDDYGSVTENFNNIAKLWSATLKHEITPQQVGLCLIQLKIAREMNKHKHDNLVDIAGYAATLEKLHLNL